MDFEKGVMFDPGYSQHTFVFSQNIEQINSILSRFKSPHQKKFQFKVYSAQILKLFENSCSFYLGCLLWASFINQYFKDNPKKILDNNFLGKETDDEQIFYEINFLLGYFEKFEKDTKYYLGKAEQLPSEFHQILSVYKEFLRINENFKNALTTADIKLPPQVKELSKDELETILNKIEAVTKSGRLEELLEVKAILI